MYKILKYSFIDLIRGRWIFIYLLFYLLIGFGLLFLNNDLSNAIITLMNIIIVLVPLISCVFGITYYYNSKDFTQLLLAQPIKRKNVFLAQYLGVAISLSSCLIIGLSIPFVFFGVFDSSSIWDFFLLIIVGGILTFIFISLSFNIGISNDNKLKGFGYTVLLWLLLAVIYDGLFLILLILFNEYSLNYLTLWGIILNPIDLSRTLIILNIDISALLGYTGATFKMFLGNLYGVLSCIFLLLLWLIIPVLILVKKVKNKDF